MPPICQPFSNKFPTVCTYFSNFFQLYATHWAMFQPFSTICNPLPIICQPFATYLSIILFANNLSITYLPTICQLFANHLPPICQPFSIICQQTDYVYTNSLKYGTASVQNQLALICNNVDVIFPPFGNFFYINFVFIW